MTPTVGIPSSGHAQSGIDRMISRVVGAAIAALFKRSQQVEATIRAEPLSKLWQGSIDGFDLLGSGLVMYNGLKITQLELYAQAVSIDFSHIFQGQVKLHQPTQATMRVIMTESDLAESLNTPFVLGKLGLLQIDGDPLTLHHVQIRIQNDGTITIQAQAQLKGDKLALDFSAQVGVEDRQRIQFINPVLRGEPGAVALASALVAHVNDLLNLDKFALDGSRLRVDRIRIRDHQIVFYGSAELDRFPSHRST